MISLLIGVMYIIMVLFIGYYGTKNDWRKNPKYRKWLIGDKKLNYKQLNALHEKGLKDL